MSAVKILRPLNPAFTDADWGQDFIFEGEDWSGSGVSIVLVRYGTGFELAVGSGVLEPTNDGYVSIRASAETMANVSPGMYAGEVRRLYPNGEIEAALLFQILIQKGASQYLAADSAQFGELEGATLSGSTLQIVRGPSAVQVIRAGGRKGDKGDKGDNAEAQQVTFDDAVINLSGLMNSPVTNVQEAIEALYHMIAGGGLGQLDFSRPENSGLLL